ncbi:Vps54-domain-containing protein [Artomyces pyxidatus]|uniref:Vps54-domain-containing protein n=1 Tax=Artomyces pyxidatus TaxID=48021 RepID=A0ACB8T6Q6_9AGAM|nr:Vps54-domain-containing protein [Artomyces pyxidatus]
MSDYTSSPSRPASPVGPLPEITTARPAYRFNWDPAARRPGPGSVSETTEGRGDYFNATPRVDIYGASASSSTLVHSAVPSQWSSAKHGFHAISTVVNNPHKKSAPPKAHAAVPSVPPADLPRVRRKDFDAYLRAIGPEWERFQKSAELGRSGAAQLAESSSSASSTVEFDLEPEAPRARRAIKSLPPLSSIPEVFFVPDFNLGDPRTFNAVAETSPSASDSSYSSSLPPPSLDPSALAHSLPLLEKLSHHADTIEQHLVHEIARRATPFFAALSNLQDLQAESARCLSRIQSLRSQLQDVDNQGALRGLRGVQKETRLGHLRKVREGVRMVGGVVEMVGVVRNLVGAGQWGEALNVVDDLRAMWDGPSASSEEEFRNTPRTPLPSVSEEETTDSVPICSNKSTHVIPLSSLKAFAALPEQLQTLTLEIAASLTTDLVAILKVDLAERVDGIYSSSRADADPGLHDRLRPIIHGLVRTRSLREAVDEWRGVVLGEVRGIIKRHLPSFEPEDDDSRSRKGAPDPPWINDLRTMDRQRFVELLRSTIRSFLNLVEGLQPMNSVLLEILEGVKPPSSPADLTAIHDTLVDILASSTELANVLTSKVFAARAEQHAKLELQEFVELFNESWSFVVRCEVICRHMIVGLRGVVVSQAKTFLQTFHQTRISQSAKLVEDEQWSPAEVTSSVQRIVNLIVDAAVHDPHEFIVKLAPAIATPPSPLPNSSSLRAPASPSPVPGSPGSRPVSPRPVSPRPRLHANGSTSSTSKHLRVEDRAYFSVSATQEALILLTDYLKVIVNLSLLTTDTMSRVIEFLKAFNSRTCQVVLGAGAMRSAGLKNITAKHLALASQSLSIMIALIPYVRETFRRHLNPKQAVMLVEFDKLKRDYQEHQNEIHSKLIAIMGDRLAAHIKTLQTVNWADPPAKSGVNDYMELLVKETVTLHKVLSRYLSSTVVEVCRFNTGCDGHALNLRVQYVMSQVFAAINHRLSEEYAKIELPSPEAKARLLADAHHLHTKFSALKSVGAPTAMLETVVSEKRISGASRPSSPLPLPPADIPLASPRALPAKRGSLFTNDRIKGMLRGTHGHPGPEKIVSPTLPPAVPEKRPISPMPFNGVGLGSELGSTPSLGLTSRSVTPTPVPTPAPDPPEEKTGFKQIDSDMPVDGPGEGGTSEGPIPQGASGDGANGHVVEGTAGVEDKPPPTPAKDVGMNGPRTAGVEEGESTSEIEKTPRMPDAATPASVEAAPASS